MPFINRCGGGGSAKLQSKTVKSTTSKQTVSPDSGYDGFSSVTVSPIKLQAKSVSPLTTSAKVFPDTGYDGLSQVTVNKMDLVSKTVTPTKEKQTVLPGAGYDGLSSVVVNGDTNLVAANVKKGVSIFGVTGSLIPDVLNGSVNGHGDNIVITTSSTFASIIYVAIWASTYPSIVSYADTAVGMLLMRVTDPNISIGGNTYTYSDTENTNAKIYILNGTRAAGPQIILSRPTSTTISIEASYTGTDSSDDSGGIPLAKELQFPTDVTYYYHIISI